jgi:hypothetical protein
MFTKNKNYIQVKKKAQINSILFTNKQESTVKEHLSVKNEPH